MIFDMIYDLDLDSSLDFLDLCLILPGRICLVLCVVLLVCGLVSRGWFVVLIGVSLYGLWFDITIIQ